MSLITDQCTASILKESEVKVMR